MGILFRSPEEQKKFIWENVNKFYPDFKTAGYYYRDYLRKTLNKKSIVLDAGCGSRGILYEFKGDCKKIIGVDRDRELLWRNKFVDEKIEADLASIPLESESIDIVVAEFVLEHLKKPKDVFKEINRILKPGGVFIFLTPNVLNPIMGTSKFLPHFLHKFFLTKVLKKKIKAHQTFYKTNSYTNLVKGFNGAGFEGVEIVRAGNPEYLGFCKPLVVFSVLFDKFLNSKLKFLQMYLIGCAEKK